MDGKSFTKVRLEIVEEIADGPTVTLPDLSDNTLGNLWVEQWWFGVNGKCSEHLIRSVSAMWFGGLLETYESYAEKTNCKKLVVENERTGSVSWVLLDSNGMVWQITSLTKAPERKSDPMHDVEADPETGKLKL